MGRFLYDPIGRRAEYAIERDQSNSKAPMVPRDSHSSCPHPAISVSHTTRTHASAPSSTNPITTP